MKIDVRGLTFDVRVEGPSAPRGTVLLLHGFPQHGGEWDAVVPALHAAGLRTVAPDQRGYSPQARPTDVAAYRIEEPVADALALLDALDITAPVHLVGHDWGALVGWPLVAAHPRRVASFTAVSVPHPAATSDAIAIDADQRARLSYIGLFRMVGKAEAVLLDDDAARLRAMFGGSGLDPAGVDRYAAPMREPGALTAALNWYRALEPAAARPPASPVPTTYVWSDEDLAIGRVAAQTCAKYVEADYRFVELPGVTHWIPDQAPEPLAEAILDRVARSPAPS
jgi:pimeloyl-ACP methyl ester carboxylesterase